MPNTYSRGSTLLARDYLMRNKYYYGTGDRADLYYSLLAGGARAKLLESIVDLNFLEFMHKEKEIYESDLIEKLELHSVRAKKWLFLLTREGFLERDNTNSGILYRMGPLSKALFKENCSVWWFSKQMTYSWEAIAYENLVDVLKGKEVKNDEHWPPKDKKDTQAIECWMRYTCLAPIQAIEKALDLNNIEHLVDIGGGDGSMACYFARKYPNLQITIYNLPEAISIARQNIEQAELWDQITVVEGNFLTDEKFPCCCDLVLFSRVLCDWSAETAEKLLKMAYAALNPGGRVAICEAFQEKNAEFSLAWEFRYIFWNELEIEVFKSSFIYKKILATIGFSIERLSQRDRECIYAVLIAKKPSPFALFEKLKSYLTRWRLEHVDNVQIISKPLFIHNIKKHIIRLLTPTTVNT
jgi:precorrin-6B methylase 2